MYILESLGKVIINRKPLNMRYLLLSLILFLSCAFSAFSMDPSSKNKKHILVIHSYHQSFVWTDSISHGIESVLTPLENKVETFYEYLDTKRFVDPIFIESFEHKYKLLCAKMTCDAIIVSDNHALNFVIKNRERFFKDIPIIFCGINNYKPELLKGQKGITGIAEYAAIDSTLMLMHKLHPQKKLLIINDRTVTGLANKAIVMNALPRLEKDLFIEFSDKQNMKGILEKVSSLTDEWMIYLFPFTMDADGDYYSFNDAVRLVSSASPVPIYGSWDFYLGRGIVGGYITSGVKQGKLAGELALSVINGANPDTIPVLEKAAVDLKFDHPVMLSYGIEENYLPEGAIIVNRKKSFFERNVQLLKNSIRLGLLIIFVLLVHAILRHQQKKILQKRNQELDLEVEQRSLELIEANDSLQKKNEEIIKQEELTKLAYLRLKAILNNSLVGIVVTDSKGKIIDQNTRISEILSCDKGELLGQNIKSTFLSESNFDLLMDEYRQLEGDETFVRNEVPLKRDDDSKIWAKIYISDMHYSDIDEACIWVIDDVTETVVNRTKLEQRTSELKESNETKDQFFSIIAHDLKGPLAPVLGLLEIISKNYNLFSEEDKLVYIDDCYKSAQDMNALLDNLLRWGRIQIGGVSWSPQIIDVYSIADSVILTLQNIAKAKGIKLKNNIPENIKAFGDENMIKTVVLNLVNNAIKFTHKDGLIEVAAEVKDSRVEIVVSDNGVGIDEQDVKYLFDIDKKTQHQGTNKETGTGLGLIIVKELVEKNKGSIRVESELNKGTRIYFDLPINVK